MPLETRCELVEFFAVAGARGVTRGKEGVIQSGALRGHRRGLQQDR